MCADLQRDCTYGFHSTGCHSTQFDPTRAIGVFTGARLLPVRFYPSSVLPNRAPRSNVRHRSGSHDLYQTPEWNMFGICQLMIPSLLFPTTSQPF